jgi:hypothetical protein
VFFGLDVAKFAHIDASLRAALQNHPSLSEYLVYIPFNLTGRAAAGKRGVSEAERIEYWKKKVEGDVSSRGKQLEIKLRSATEIASQMHAVDPNGGIRH